MGSIASTPSSLGHNGACENQPVAQWQRPHLAPDEIDHDRREPDIDLVESAFASGFAAASDPTSFLRLARIPFDAIAIDGTKLVLLRVEIDAVTDVGSLTPHVGAASFRYDPLPAAMVTQRRGVRFIYFDGHGLQSLNLTQVRELA